MAEGLIVLVAVASVIGAFYVVLFSVLARRERRVLRTLKGRNPASRGLGSRQVSWHLAGLVLVLVATLAVISFITWRSLR
jgi:hypothetical protein